MAEATKVVLEDEVVKDKFLSCSICLERFNNPKILPCLHTFCVLCLDSYIERTSKDDEFLCPCCRTVTKAPLAGAVDFKTNFFMNSLVDFFCGKDAQHLCSICSLKSKTAPAISKCMDCSDYLCAACSSVHCKTRLTLNHSVVSLEDIYSEGKSAEIAAKRTLSCSEHPEENVRYYCTACNKPVCRDCKALTHQDHKCVTFLEALQERKPILQEKIKRLTEKYQAVQSEVADLEKYHENVQQEHNLVVDQVEKIYQTFLKSLSDFRSQILQDTKSRTEQVLKQNNMVLEETKAISAQLYSYREYLSTTVDRAADVEILDTFKTSKEHLDTLCAGTSRPDCQNSVTLGQYTYANSKTIKRFLLDCHTCNSLDKIAKSVQPKLKGGVLDMTSPSVQKLPNPVANTTCSGLALSEDGDLYACCAGKVYQYTQGWVNITSEIGVQGVRAHDMIMDGDTLMVSYIGPFSGCTIVFYKPATKTSTITRLGFCRSCPGICLRRDSSTMYVTDSRDQNIREINRGGWVVKLWKSTSCYSSSLCYITQCKDGNLFVSDYFNHVEIFSPDLKYIKSVDNPSIIVPTGLQADDYGNVYVASEYSNAVYLMSSDETFSKAVLCDKDGIKSPRSLSLTKDKLAIGHEYGVWIYTLD